MRQQLEYCHVRRSGWIELKVGLIYVRNETDIECWYSKIELYDMILIRWAVKESHMAFTFYDRPTCLLFLCLITFIIIITMCCSRLLTLMHTRVYQPFNNIHSTLVLPITKAVKKSNFVKEKSKTRVWFELVISLKIIFELKLIGKPKSLSLTWLGLIN